MKLGAYTACLHDRSLRRGPRRSCGELGLTSAEINSGGFLPAAAPAGRRPARQRRHAREDYLGQFEPAGITLTGAELQRQPAEPRPGRRPKHAAGPAPTRSSSPPCSASSASSPCPGCPAPTPAATAAVVDRAALGQPVPRRARLPVERGRRPVLEGHPGAGRRRRRQGRASRCTRTTSSSTRRPCTGSSSEINATHVGRRDGPEPPVLAGHRPGRGHRAPRRPRLPRGRQGHPHQRAAARSTASSTTGSTRVPGGARNPLGLGGTTR